MCKFLVVEPEEGELHPRKLAAGHVLLGRVEGKRADLLPVAVGWRTDSHARDAEHLGPDIALSGGGPRNSAKPGGRCGGDRASGSRAFQHCASVHLSGHEPVKHFRFH